MHIDYKISKAEYYGNYKIKFTFSDGAINVFNFKNLVTCGREGYERYLDITLFKKFRIQRRINCIAWGKNVDMQVPGFILYSEKTVGTGWTKEESFYDLKKRLPKRLYYESFVDNNIWAGIQILLELLGPDKQANLFAKKFDKGTKKECAFQIFSEDTSTKIELQPFGLVFNIKGRNLGAVHYTVNFQNDLIRSDLKGENLTRLEALLSNLYVKIKKSRHKVKVEYRCS